MIKGLDGQQLVHAICEDILKYPFALCLDVTSFDSSQRGLIMEIEHYSMVKVLGREWADAWMAMCQNPNNIKCTDSASIHVNCRNSGEMTTSLSNTQLMRLMATWALE